MKVSQRAVRSSTHSIPDIRFEDQALTSFSGLVVFQRLFDILELKARLRRCVRHLDRSSSYGPATILLLLIIHLVMGWHRLRDLVYYCDDPLVLRVLGLRRLPDVSTVCRSLGAMDLQTIDNIRGLVREVVLDRVMQEKLPRLTVDFDGSVQSTKSRRTEGTAIGYNPKSKGARSYYPLFCTVAQTDQVFDVLHRPGNVHDSKGAPAFIKDCIERVLDSGSKAVLEVRIDGAHYNQETCLWLDDNQIEFTVSVPFLRLAGLKDIVENRKRWRRIDGDWGFVARLGLRAVLRSGYWPLTRRDTYLAFPTRSSC